MIPFYFEAKTQMAGRLVELTIYRGARDGKKIPLGSLNFDQEEWESFRVVLVGGMRIAGHARIPIEFMDGTRRARAENVH